MPRPDPYAPSPMPAPYRRLKQLWDAGGDWEQALADIDWDTPVFAWRGRQDRERVGRLVHPLALVFDLGDPDLAAAVVERKIDHPWADLVLTQAQSDSRIPLPPMGAFWEWNLIEAAMGARAYAAAERLLPPTLARLSGNRYPSLSGVALCALLGQVDDPGVFERLWNTLTTGAHAPGTRTQQAWAALALHTVADKGHPEVALALARRYEDLVPDHDDLAALTRRGHLAPALALAQLACTRGPNFLASENMFQWVQALEDRCKNHPCEASAQAAVWLMEHWPPARASLLDPECNKDGSNPMGPAALYAAKLLAILPEGRADHLLEQSQGVSWEVMGTWISKDLVDRPAVAPWIDHHARIAPEWSRQMALNLVFNHLTQGGSKWAMTLDLAESIEPGHDVPGLEDLVVSATRTLAIRMEEWASRLAVPPAMADAPQALARLAGLAGPGVWASVCLERRVPSAAPSAPKSRL